jgi:hypothetical protein
MQEDIRDQLECNLRSIDAEIQENLLSRSRRRVTVERPQRNWQTLIIIRRKDMVIEILRVIDPVNIHNMLALCGGTRCRGSNR